MLVFLVFVLIFIFEPSLAVYKYNYTSGNNTSFSRKIFIQEVPTQNIQDREILITSSVSFTTGRRSNTVTFKTYLKIGMNFNMKILI